MRRLGRFFSGELTAGRLVFWGGLVTLLYAVLSTGVYHPDEHFQILEYAHMKLFGKPAPEQLPWEYGLKMRPGFQPMIAYAVGKLLLFAGVYSPHLLALLLRLFSGALSMWAVWSFGRAAVRRGWLGPSGRNWFLGLSFGLWMLVYLHVRFSSEILAGNLLMLFVSFYLLSDRDRGVFRRGLALGLLAGGAFVARYQIGFALLGFGLWMLAFDRRWRMIAGMLLSFSLMIGAGVLCDRWLYGEWTCTPLNYLTENMLHGHIDTFGIDPWYYYLYAIPLEGGIVFGGVVLAAAAWFFVRYPRHMLTWTFSGRASGDRSQGGPLPVSRPAVRAFLHRATGRKPASGFPASSCGQGGRRRTGGRQRYDHDRGAGRSRNQHMLFRPGGTIGRERTAARLGASQEPEYVLLL